MAKDPLKIIGKPNPTPEARAAAEALSKQTGRPAKLCRAALLEASHDVARATALLNDGKFLLFNAETDDYEMMALAQRLMNQQSPQPRQDPLDSAYFQMLQQAIEGQGMPPDDYEERVEKATGTKLKDPVLGPLKWDTFWEGRVNAPAFGKMSLSVETDRELHDVATPPGDEHRAAFQHFLAAASEIYAKVERANFEYLDRVRDVYEDDLPKVTEPADLWKELSSPTLHIPHQDGKAWRVELLWNCSWDEEHGHAVHIEGGKVVNVGIQGEGWPDCFF